MTNATPVADPDAARGPGKAPGRKSRAGMPLISAKLKSTQLGTGARPNVASVFTAEGQLAARKVSRRVEGNGRSGWIGGLMAVDR